MTSETATNVAPDADRSASPTNRCLDVIARTLDQILERLDAQGLAIEAMAKVEAERAKAIGGLTTREHVQELTLGVSRADVARAAVQNTMNGRLSRIDSTLGKIATFRQVQEILARLDTLQRFYLLRGAARKLMAERLLAEATGKRQSTKKSARPKRARK